jgi:hypothetical protein
MENRQIHEPVRNVYTTTAPKVVERLADEAGGILSVSVK